MTDLWKSLVTAENLADEMGDINWFKQVYSGAREYQGIRESIECALRAQDLLQEYNKRMGC